MSDFNSMSTLTPLSNNPITHTRQPKTQHQPKATEQPNIITPANIEWQTDDTGNRVPVSGEFGDVYFSHADGLAESRHVFLEHNQLPERLANLAPQQCFTVAELGFGTGLNVLALWQLWQQLRTTNPQLATARLHLITTEKYPIKLEDLTQILALWGQRAPELTEFIEPLLANYPPLIAGCHRLSFDNDSLTIDMWFGDAADSLATLNTATLMQHNPHVDAWFLDGFAPSCNQSLWADTIFAQMQRLSYPSTTAATYSCAGIVKRGLKSHGFQIKKVQGFGRKREMLTAVMIDSISPNPVVPNQVLSDNNHDYSSISSDTLKSNHKPVLSDKPRHIAVIGAGVSGLLSAWSLANRGIMITLLDKTAPLAGSSGNPRALLAPKMTPIHHVDEHLHTIGYLYSSRFYRQLNDYAEINHTAPVLEPTGALDLLMKANIDTQQIADYPDEMATTLSAVQARCASGLMAQDLTENLYLPQSGLVNPQALKTVILTHPNITYQQLNVTQIKETESCVFMVGRKNDDNAHPISIEADSAVICAAYESHHIDERIFDCRKIRGQLSWFTPTAEQCTKLPKLPLKYGGYCAPFIGQTGDAALNPVAENKLQFLLGASFVRNDIKTDSRSPENQQNRDKLVADIPELAAIIPTNTDLWQSRAGVRTQTPDYHPILGQLTEDSKIWVLSAMGAKGYAFAPICSEALAAIMLGEFAPLSAAMLARLSPNRTRLQTPLNNH